MAKRRKPPKDKKTGLPKKYLSGLKGAKRTRRSSLIKRVSNLYKAGKSIPKALLKSRTRA